MSNDVSSKDVLNFHNEKLKEENEWLGLVLRLNSGYLF